MKTPLKLCLAALSAALLLTGCSSVSPDESSSGGTAPVSSAAQQPVSSASPQGNFNPLTGEHNLPDAAVGKRPVSIMVSNIKKALPQYGLSKADICYEVLAEGGITRIMAVFSDYQNIPTVGPVRSVRDYFVDLAAPHNTIFAHFGGSPKGYEVIKSRDIDNIDGITLLSAFQQDKQLAASKGREHSFFMTASTLKKGLDKKKYTTSGETPAAFKFADSPANATMGSETAGTIKVPYSGYCTATFDYDAATGKYKKEEFGAKHMDAGAGKQIAVQNVIVVKTSCTPVPGDKSGRIQVALSSGSGYYFTGGKATPINWKKGSYQKPFVFTDKSGNEISVAPGQTWVSVVSSGNTVSYS